MTLGINYGIIFPTIAEQVDEQGFYFRDEKEAARVEQLRKEINDLRFSQIITDTEGDKAFKRLHKRISKGVSPK